MKFSQRIGVTPLTKELQIESLDIELKNGLWNIYDMYILQKIPKDFDHHFRIYPSSYFANSLWHHHFKKTIDEAPTDPYYIKKEIKNYFFSCEWYKIYELIEYSVNFVGADAFNLRIDNKVLCSSFNNILEREFAGYRIIEGMVSPITNPTEIKEIEESLSLTNNFTSLKSCNIHLKASLIKLSDKLNPDYRNSIKESISAVEAVGKTISDNPKDTLGSALDKIKGKLKIHASLERGFKQIYGYTSDTDGIRHALTDNATCDFEDAKFMLVSCSAFINYLIVKANKADIKIK